MVSSRGPSDGSPCTLRAGRRARLSPELSASRGEKLVALRGLHAERIDARVREVSQEYRRLCLVLSCVVLCCLVLSCHALSCLILFCPVMTGRLSCVLYCPALSCLVWDVGPSAGPSTNTFCTAGENRARLPTHVRVPSRTPGGAPSYRDLSRPKPCFRSAASPRKAAACAVRVWGSKSTWRPNLARRLNNAYGDSIPKGLPAPPIKVVLRWTPNRLPAARGSELGGVEKGAHQSGA